MQPTQPDQPWRGGGQPPWYSGQPAPGGMAGMRASNADRERAVDVLKAAFAEGRLTKQEYEQRVEWAYQAYTYGDLGRLVADLPQGPLPPAPLVPAPMVFHPRPVAPFPVMLPPPPMPRRPTNPYAIGSLICGLIAPFGGITAVPAVVLGHVAKSKLRGGGEEGDGLAAAGLVLGWLSIVFWLMVVIATAA